MRSITNRSSSDRTTELRRRTEWITRSRPLNAYTATQESYTSIIAGKISALEAGCCIPTSSVTIDDDIYVVGYFSGEPLNFYDSNNIVDISMSRITPGNRTMYLVKYNSSGDPQWCTKIGNTGQNIIAPAVSADMNGDIYITGKGGPLSTIQLFNAGSLTPDISLPLDTNTEKIWLAKYNKDGVAQWVTYVSSISLLLSNNPIRVSFDVNHNIYFYVDYSRPGGMKIYETNNSTPVKTVPPSVFGRSNALIKYDMNGKFVWAANIISDNTCQPFSSICDNAGNVYIAGVYVVPINIYNSDDSFNTTLTTSGSFDSYLIKYNSLGFVQWLTHVGGIGQESRPSICIDADQHVYIASEYFSNPAYIYSYNVTPPTFIVTNLGNADICVAKYNSTSGIAQWVSKVGGTSPDRYPVISVDNSLNIILTGITRSTSCPIFSSDDLTSPALTITPTVVGPLNSCVILVSFDKNGIVNWGTRTEPTNIQTIFPDITIDQAGNIYLTSEFESNTTMKIYDVGESSPSRELTGGTSSRSTFIVKYDSMGKSTWAAQIGQYAFTPVISTPYKAAF
jgi:hypothetical protein